MKSLILATTTRILTGLLLVFSVFLLLRGHNLPGGGFAGGLVAAVAFALSALAFGVTEARRRLAVHPRGLVTAGLAVALVSGLVGPLAGLPFMTGRWGAAALPVVGELGTPLFFDLGVYLVVTGVVLHILFALAAEDEPGDTPPEAP